MRVRERLQYVAENADDFGDGERAAAEPRAERLAVHVRHRIEGEAFRVAGREDRNDVGLLQPGDGFDFALEAVDADALR